jgi:serine protease SohB
MLQTLRNSRLAVFSLRISGVISSNTLKQVNAQLARYSLYRPAALAVIVNSPGGAAASSHLLAKRLQAYAQQHAVPMYGFAEGLAASGGYMVLSACKEIYVNPGSLLGSVGARMDLLNFKQMALKYGIERRTWASSPQDVHLRVDLLSDLTPDTKKWLSGMLEETHQDFKREVQTARSAHMSSVKPDDAVLNGEVYIGQKAIDMG